MPRIEKYKFTVVAVGRMEMLGGARRAISPGPRSTTSGFESRCCLSLQYSISVHPPRVMKSLRRRATRKNSLQIAPGDPDPKPMPPTLGARRRIRAAVNAYGALKPVHYAYDLALPQRAIRSGIPTGPALGGIGSGARSARVPRSHDHALPRIWHEHLECEEAALRRLSLCRWSPARNSATWLPAGA